MNEIGILYDFIYYGLMNYNVDLCTSEYDFYSEEDFKYYSEFKDSVLDSPGLHDYFYDYLKVFFYKREGRLCLLSSLLINDIDFNNPEILQSYRNLLCDKNKMANNFTEYYFNEKLTENNAFEMINSLNFNHDIKIYLFYVFCNFEKCIDALISIFDIHTDAISGFHKLNAGIINNTIKRACDKEVFLKIKNFLPFANSRSITCHISLFSPYLHAYKDNNLCLGVLFHKTIEYINNSYDLNFQSVCNVFSNPIRYEIIRLLIKKPYTLSELSRIFVLSRTSMEFHVRIMIKTGLLSPIKNGTSIRFKINYRYFELAKNVVHDSLSKLEKEVHYETIMEEA